MVTKMALKSGPEDRPHDEEVDLIGSSSTWKSWLGTILVGVYICLTKKPYTRESVNQREEVDDSV